MQKPLVILFFVLIVASSVAAQQVLRPGAKAPAFSGHALDGSLYDLEQLQGRIVVLTFWNTRCAICHSEIPNLNRVVERYRDTDVVFLAVTMDNEARVNPYIKQNPFNFTIVPNGFGVILKYADRDRNGNINMGFPAHFLINRDGAIALRADGWDKAGNLESQISRLLSMQ